MGEHIQFFDIAHLTWDHIQGDRLNYKRKKTKVYFNVKIQPETGNILEYFKRKKT